MKWIKASRSSGNGNCVQVAFRKSSRSATNGSCVEVGFHAASASGGTNCVEVALGDRVLVRDSKDPDGPRLAFDPATWTQFLAGIQAGQFDPTP